MPKIRKHHPRYQYQSDVRALARHPSQPTIYGVSHRTADELLPCFFFSSGRSSTRTGGRPIYRVFHSCPYPSYSTRYGHMHGRHGTMSVSSCPPPNRLNQRIMDASSTCGNFQGLQTIPRIGLESSRPSADLGQIQSQRQDCQGYRQRPSSSPGAGLKQSHPRRRVPLHSPPNSQGHEKMPIWWQPSPHCQNL
jgi:hypothetical protein